MGNARRLFQQSFGQITEYQPDAPQSKTWVDQEAILNRHSVTAGKSDGTSLMSGRNICATATRTMNKTIAPIVPFHRPCRATQCFPRLTAMAAATSENRTIVKNRPVRIPMVSGWPTAGGFAGYLRLGTQ